MSESDIKNFNLKDLLMIQYKETVLKLSNISSLINENKKSLMSHSKEYGELLNLEINVNKAIHMLVKNEIELINTINS